MKKVSFDYAKIVGSGNKEFWAQTHLFFPKKEKRWQAGHLMAVFALQKKEEAVDITSFGKEIVTRFHEIYYSSEEGNIFQRLQTSIKELAEEFEQRISLQMTAGVILEQKNSQPVGYFARKGRGGVFLHREGKVVSLLSPKKSAEDGEQAVSGFLQTKDKLLLGTEQFFNIISLGSVRAGMRKKEPEQVGEQWSMQIQGREKNSLSAAVVVSLKEKVVQQKTAAQVQVEKKEQEKKSAKKQKKKGLQKRLQAGVKTLKKAPQTAKAFIKDFKTERTKYYQDRRRKEKGKKTTLTIALILIVLLSVSVFFGVQRQRNVQEEQKVQAVLEKVDQQYDQANSLKEVNPVRARSLLEEAKAIINEKKEGLEGEAKAQLEERLKEIDDQLAGMLKKYVIEDPEVFLDLNLVKDAYQGEAWGIDEDTALLLGKEGKTILTIDLQKKSYEIVGGGEEYADAQAVGSVNQRGFIVDQNQIWVVSVQEKEVIEEKKEQAFGKLQDAVGFGGNLYVLDSGEKQVWKYVGVDSGLGEQTGFLEEKVSQLEKGVSMAIDGAVWVLGDNGEVYKLIRGERDNFVITGLPDSLNQPKEIYTDSDLKDLYLLDQKNTRVMVINKETGEYQEQYVWQGLAGAKDLYASEEEGIILVLTGQRIYQLEMK